jgi:uncharacterized protein
MGAREFARGRCAVARLPHGGDLLTQIAAVADAHGMAAAELRAIGALQQAHLAFYNQQEKVYQAFTLDEPLELLALVGNVSRRDGGTAVHAHATLARPDGSCLGGHVQPGCTIFACELVLQELLGEPLERHHDAQTGLPLWQGL